MTNAMKADTTCSTPDDTDRIYSAVARSFGVPREQLMAKTLLIEDLGVDSIDLLALAFDLEEEFDVVVTDQALCQIRTVGDAVPCVVNALELRRISCEASAVQTICESVTR